MIKMRRSNIKKRMLKMRNRELQKKRTSKIKKKRASKMKKKRKLQIKKKRIEIRGSYWFLETFISVPEREYILSYEPNRDKLIQYSIIKYSV